MKMHRRLQIRETNSNSSNIFGCWAWFTFSSSASRTSSTDHRNHLPACSSLSSSSQSRRERMGGRASCRRVGRSVLTSHQISTTKYPTHLFKDYSHKLHHTYEYYAHILVYKLYSSKRRHIQKLNKRNIKWIWNKIGSLIKSTKV